MEPDFTQDSQVWDRTETVTYYSKTEEKPPPVGAPIERVLFHMIRKETLPADSPLLKMERTAHLPGISMGGIVPKDNDLIQRADGTFWVIKVVEKPGGVDYRVWLIKSAKR